MSNDQIRKRLKINGVSCNLIGIVDDIKKTYTFVVIVLVQILSIKLLVKSQRLVVWCKFVFWNWADPDSSHSNVLHSIQLFMKNIVSFAICTHSYWLHERNGYIFILCRAHIYQTFDNLCHFISIWMLSISVITLFFIRIR